MTAIIARPATGATTAGATPKKEGPGHHPAPPMRRADPALPEPLTALDFAERMHEIGMHWWSLIDHVLETQTSQRGKNQPLPEWALQILKDQGRHHASYDEFQVQRDNLCEALRLSRGEPTYCYEVWGDRTTRISLRHDSIADAMPDYDHWRANGHPNAFIVKLHRRNNCSTAQGVAMLDTLLGAVQFAGVSLAEGQDDEYVFQMMDETGRTIHLKANELRGHPIIARVTSPKNRESLMAWLDKAEKDGRP